MSSTFRVLQYNMQFGQVWDENDPDHAPVCLEDSIREIKRINADIVLLQEVEQALFGGEQRKPPPNYLQLRSAFPEYESFFSYPRADHKELPFGIGLAIFSRWPLEETFRKDLPAPPIKFTFEGKLTFPTDRLLIGVRTRVDGRPVQIYNTHLQAFFMIGASSDDHREQRDQVEAVLRSSRLPTLIGADFNSAPDESVLEQFSEAGYRTVQSKEVTWRRRPYVLDHILFNSQLEAVRHAVEPTLASDHHLLWADFRFAE